MSLMSGDLDILLISFEGGYGHAGDCNARESETFELGDSSAEDRHTYIMVGLSCKSQGK